MAAENFYRNKQQALNGAYLALSELKFREHGADDPNEDLIIKIEEMLVTLANENSGVAPLAHAEQRAAEFFTRQKFMKQTPE